MQQITLSESTDLTSVLKIEKYEPPIPPELSGVQKGTFPGFLIKTDSHRLQAYPRLIDEMNGVDCYATIKIDGTSSTFYSRDEEFGVCSRNMELCESDTNTYWRMAKEYELQKKMLPFNIAVQGEIYGPGIQGNKLGVDTVQLAVFDVFGINFHEYMDFRMLKYNCELLGLPMVDVVYEGAFEWKSVDELIEFASSMKYPNGAPAEGIVIRPKEEMVSQALKGRMAFKVISPDFLARNKE